MQQTRLNKVIKTAAHFGENLIETFFWVGKSKIMNSSKCIQDTNQGNLLTQDSNHCHDFFTDFLVKQILLIIN